MLGPVEQVPAAVQDVLLGGVHLGLDCGLVWSYLAAQQDWWAGATLAAYSLPGTLGIGPTNNQAESAKLLDSITVVLCCRAVDLLLQRGAGRGLCAGVCLLECRLRSGLLPGLSPCM